MSLPTAKLGKSGPEVPRLGLGLMGLSAFYGTIKPDSERLAFLDTAYELGETFWDSGTCIYPSNHHPHTNPPSRHVRRQRGPHRQMVPSQPFQARAHLPGHQIRQPQTPRRFVLRRLLPGLRAPGVREIPRPAGHQHHRPLLLPPAGPDDPHREDRAGDGTAQGGGQDPVPRPERVQRRVTTARARRPPHRRRADGVLAVLAGHREPAVQAAGDSTRAGRCGCGILAAGAGSFERGDHLAGPVRGE